MINHIGQMMGTNMLRAMRTLFSIYFSTFFLCSCAVQQNFADVDRFVARREICEHYAGEFPDPPNPQRMKEVIDGVNKYCTGTDAELAGLKARYANNPVIINRLNQYEPSIESDQ
jgi:hypothetical protein